MEVAGKVRLDVNVTKELTLFIMGGYGTDDNLSDDPGNAIDAHGRGFYKPWGGNWAVWGGGTYKFNAKTAFNLQASADDDKNYALAANVAYTIVPGFTITTEVDWDHSVTSTMALRSATSPRPTRRIALAASSVSSAISDRTPADQNGKARDIVAGLRPLTNPVYFRRGFVLWN